MWIDIVLLGLGEAQLNIKSDVAFLSPYNSGAIRQSQWQRF